MNPFEEKYRPGYLTLALLLLIVVYPLLEKPDFPVLPFFVLTVLLASLFAAGRKGQKWFGVALGVPAVLLSVAAYFYQPSAALSTAALTAWLAFFLFTALVFLLRVLAAKSVSADAIFGAVSVYLLIGIFWGFLYALIELWIPGSISLPGPAETNGSPRLPETFYFSFVTLTTVGYGDIAPVLPFTRSLAILESVTGVLYVAVLISRLVGIHVAQSAGRTTPDDK